MKSPTEDMGVADGCDWLKLPTPWSITIIMSKETRLAEQALENVLVEHQLF